MRILVIEDERKVAEFVARGLRAERFAVDVANDGQAGWDMARVCQYRSGGSGSDAARPERA